MDGTVIVAPITVREEISFPKDEIVWVQYYDKDHKLSHIITSKRSSREHYFLYRVEDNHLVKIAKSNSPQLLEEKIKG